MSAPFQIRYNLPPKNVQTNCNIYDLSSIKYVLSGAYTSLYLSTSLFKIFQASSCICVVKGTLLATAVIMAQDVFAGKLIGIRQPCEELYQRIIGFLSELSVFGFVTAFNGNGIIVSGLYRIGRSRPRAPDLQNLTIIANDKMGADAGLVHILLLFKIASVLFCAGIGIGRIVHKNIFYLCQWFSRSGIFIGRQKILRPLRDALHSFLRKFPESCHFPPDPLPGPPQLPSDNFDL